MCVVNADDPSGTRRSIAMLLGDNTRVNRGSPNSARTGACGHQPGVPAVGSGARCTPGGAESSR